MVTVYEKVTAWRGDGSPSAMRLLEGAILWCLGVDKGHLLSLRGLSKALGGNPVLFSHDYMIL